MRSVQYRTWAISLIIGALMFPITVPATTILLPSDSLDELLDHAEASLSALCWTQRFLRQPESSLQERLPLVCTRPIACVSAFRSMRRSKARWPALSREKPRSKRPTCLRRSGRSPAPGSCSSSFQRQKIPVGSFLPLSMHHERSFYGRYYGVVKVSAVRARLVYVRTAAALTPIIPMTSPRTHRRSCRSASAAHKKASDQKESDHAALSAR